MSLKYGILSVLALGIMLLLAFKNYEVWTQATELFPNTQKEETKPAEKKTESLATPEPAKEPLSIQTSLVMAEKNMFNPDRKDFPIRAEANKPAVRPQILLYGITMLEDYQAASIAHPGRPLRKGERETFTIKLGEKIGEYKVTHISSDRITLEAEEDRFEVLLYDLSKPKQRIYTKTETKPATVTSTIPAPTPALRATLPQAPRPTPSTESVQEKIIPPSPVPGSVTPSISSPAIRRRGTPSYQTPGISTPGAPLPGKSTPEVPTPIAPTPAMPTQENR